MRRSEAARYARWAAVAAMLLAATVAGVYAYRTWQSAQASRQAPPVVPPTVEKRSEEISFTKEEQGRKLFTVRASRSTEFKAESKNVLEDVWITIYGRQGQRYDNIHTRECDYVPATGRIVCSGEVQIDLESAAEARARPGERIIHVGTRNVWFDRESGEARTDQPVVFRFPYGYGRGNGVTYSTREAVFRLLRDVEMTLTQARGGAPAAEPVTLTGSALEYHRDDRTLRLLPPVRVRQGLRELVAGALALEFDAEMRAQRLVAGGRPQLRDSDPPGMAALTAEELVAEFHREGWTERILAAGNVQGDRRNAGGEDRLSAEKVEIEMEPGRNQPRLLTASGNVRVQSKTAAAGIARQLETSELRVAFAGQSQGGRATEIARAESPEGATLEWQAPEETTRLRGAWLAAEFGGRSRIRELAGRSGVEIERRFRNGPEQLTSAREIAMRFDAHGEWVEGELTGNVRFREGDRAAEAQRAKLVRATDLLTLAGAVVLAEPASRTTAGSVSVNQRTGEIRGEGGVHTSYLLPSSSSASVPDLAPQPAHVSAERLLANRATGRATYSGGARLWQGDAVIEAGTIEFARNERQLEARGNVRALLPGRAGHGVADGGSATSQAADLWRVRAGNLTYSGAGGRAHLSESVRAQSRAGQIESPRMDIFLSSGEGQPRQLTRAVATGGVTVRQGNRRGTAERAEYTAAEEKFVLSGGRPTLYDAARGTTTGRQLTFFLADDRILIESEAGSRTLTKHRVEK